jgi:hypothetical protein
MQMSLRCWFGLALVGAALALSACAPDGPDLGTVSGLVTLDGEPLPEATVIFQPTGEGSPSQAVTDAEGGYELIYGSGRMGALPGEHLIMVTTYQRISEADGGGTIPEKVPAKYNESSELRKTVEEGSNDIDLPLTSS